MSITDCHRYLSRCVGISADTIDILVRNGFDSVHALRAIDMDIDWYHLPPQISIGQKILLRQALDKLAADDYDGDNQDLTARQSLSIDSPIVINLDDQMNTNSMDSNGNSYNHNIEVNNSDNYQLFGQKIDSETNLQNNCQLSDQSVAAENVFNTSMKMCSICLDPLANRIKQLNCGHSFHNQCIQGWFAMENNTCPMCRQLVLSPSGFLPNLSMTLVSHSTTTATTSRRSAIYNNNRRNEIRQQNLRHYDRPEADLNRPLVNHNYHFL